MSDTVYFSLAGLWIFLATLNLGFFLKNNKLKNYFLSAFNFVAFLMCINCLFDLLNNPS